jgi:hypothetical protein
MRLPHPLTRMRVCSPPPMVQGGYTLTAGEGVGGSQFRRGDRHYGTLKYLSLYALCVHRHGGGTLYTDNMHLCLCEILIDRQYFAHFVRSQVTELMEGSLEDDAA